MTRLNLEHIIWAAGAISDDPDIIVIGSQSVLGQFPDASAELLVSLEADVYPKNKPELSDLIDGSIGEGSPFDRSLATTRTALTRAPRRCPADGKIVWCWSREKHAARPRLVSGCSRLGYREVSGGPRERS